MALRRAWIAVAAMSVLLGEGATAAVAEDSVWDDPPRAVSFDRMLNDPVWRRATADGLALRVARNAGLDSSAARTERQRSRAQFGSLGGRDARALAQQQFPELMVDDIGAPALPSGSRITGFRAANVATVSDASGRGSLMISSHPLAVPEGNGFAPVDLTLRSRGDGFAPATAAVDTLLPGRADAFLRLPHADVGVRPAGAAAVSGSVASDRVFYADVAADTDYVTTPTPGGAEVMWQLRSAQAPERLGIDLDLPPGASVRVSSSLTAPAGLAANGGVELVRDATVLATISAPLAFDADGTPVPAAYRFEDGQLTVAVDHRGLDMHYPIMVDPEVHEVWGSTDFVNCGGGPSNFQPGRWSYQQWVGPFTAICGNPEGGSTGLFVLSGPSYYGDTARGQWVWSAPNGAYIMSVWFDGLRHLASGTALYTGLYGQAWGAVANDYSDIPYGQRSYTPNSPYNSWTAVVGLYMNGGWTRPHDGLAGVRGVNIRLGDLDPPTVSLASVTPKLQSSTNQSAWFDDNQTTARVGANAYDGGLGLQDVGVLPDGSTSSIGGIHNPCAGYRSNPCPRSWNPNFDVNTRNLPEGVSAVHTWARDIVDNSGFGPYWLFRIDRTPPNIAISGELVDHATDNQLSANPAINIHATDGSPASTTTQRSGVKRVRLLLDGAVQQDYLAPETACDNCDRGLTWSIPLELLDGQHTVTVEAWDHVGHLSSHAFTVYSFPNAVANGEDSTELPFVPDDEEGSAAAASGSCRNVVHTRWRKSLAGIKLVWLKQDIKWCWQAGSITYVKRFITQDSPGPFWATDGDWRVQSEGGRGGTTFRSVVTQKFKLCPGIGPFTGCIQNPTITNDVTVGPNSSYDWGLLDN